MDLSRNELILNSTDSFIVVFAIEIEDKFQIWYLGYELSFLLYVLYFVHGYAKKKG